MFWVIVVVLFCFVGFFCCLFVFDGQRMSKMCSSVLCLIVTLAAGRKRYLGHQPRCLYPHTILTIER